MPERRNFFSLLNIRHTLQLNILITFAVLLIITVSIIIGYTYQQNSSALLSLSDNLVDQVTTTLMERTTNYLSPAAVMAQLSADIPAIDTLELTSDSPLEAYGMEVLNQYPQLAGFFVGNEQGDFLFVKRFPEGIGTQVIDRSVDPPLRTWIYRDAEGNVTSIEETTDFTYDPRERPWYIGAKENPTQPFWTNIYIFFTDQKPGITAAFPVLDDDGQLVSVVGVDVALDALSDFLQTQSIGQNGVAFILNDEGQLVAYPDLSLAVAEGEGFRPLSIRDLDTPWVIAAFDEHQNNPADTFFTFGYQGRQYITSFTPFPANFGKQWKIGVVVPQDDFIGTLKETNQISLLISFVILMVSIVIAIFISRSISRPIVILTDETKKIQNFQLDSEVEIKSPIHEVQLLSDSIVSMRRSLQTFQKYVPNELVRQVIQTGEVARLGGDKRELTIFFSDVADFTTISEQIPPEDLMLQLSEYLGTLATEIGRHYGTVDKYMGDGLMAFWGAPLENPDHALHACKAALCCQEKVAELNEKWRTEGRPLFTTRIGIHTGETLVGNMGSVERMDYTVLGDSVNLASRLESINKVYGTEIIITVLTYHSVAARFHVRPLDIVTVKGKQQGVFLYELMGEVEKTPRAVINLGEMFTRGFDAYLNKEWDVAIDLFQYLVAEYPDDVASHIYLKRCLDLKASPPDPDWVPLTRLNSK